MGKEEKKHRNTNKSTRKTSHKMNKKNRDLGRKTFIQELITKVEGE